MREEGSGTVIAAGLIGVIGMMIAIVFSLTAVADASHRAAAGADMAALAAAQTLHDPRSTGEPCQVARTIAEAEITSCRIDWPMVHIETRAVAGTMIGERELSGRATAGPVM